MIHQIPRQHRRFRQRRANRNAVRQRGNRAGVPFDNRNGMDAVARPVVIIAVPATMIGVELVQAQQSAFRDSLRASPRVQPADASAMGDGGKLRHALAPQKTRHVAADPAHAAGIEIIGFAEAGHYHALCRQAAQRMHQRQLARLALNLAVGNQRCYRAVQRPVHRPCRAARMSDSLKKVDHQRRRGEIGNVPGNDFHGS